ncbi:MAG: DUF4404 family protein [Planctomycetes bacterium]|nr:DUF4404 family protein [Planctomycetota bacterium]
MNTPIDPLRATLRELERELAQGPPLDAETRDLLERAIRDIERSLRSASHSDRASQPNAARSDGCEPGTMPDRRPERAEGPDRSSDEGSEPVDAHGTRLREAIERFETSHPTLTAVLGRLVDALGQMGI